MNNGRRFTDIVAVLGLAALMVGCNDAAPMQVFSTMPARLEFTAESRGLKFAFPYSPTFQLDRQPSPWATLSMTLTPAEKELETHIVFVLVDGETSAKMIANGPMAPLRRPC